MQGHGPAVRLRASTYAAPAEPLLAHRQVDVQPPVLGDGPPGPDPRASLEAGRPRGRKERRMSTTVTTLDWKGLSCPLPIAKTALALKTMASGTVVEVLATDPGSVPDFTAWCRS